jgi:NCS1 family nucleobase:cation symporter-1
MDESREAVKRFDKLYEFDRVPVSKDSLLGIGYFAGSFAGEHVAATEFVIGAMFVTWGATVQDIFLGLAIGNVLAVLTWTFLCAPIAVQTRLTLYWYLRRIGGPFLSVIYNVLNAVLFCILAGCMITVSASAVRIPFGIPDQTMWYPTDIRFVFVVVGVGAVVVTIAILGFKRLAGFATVCSPWLFLMFIAGAVVMVTPLGQAAGLGAIDSFETFFEMGRRVVWTGEVPATGAGPGEPMGFWKVAAFAWICNLAMHGGLSDMALFRYAKRASYGLSSAFGMFLGHYLAWIAAGVMGAGAALMLQQPLADLDAGSVAYNALGISGAIAVIIAGWTTSNPTLYRAGLAFQAVTPNWSRSKVTLVTGAVTTAIACFPFVFTRLLDFVGLYGLLLMPAGAIVITEHWLFPLLGWPRYWASRKNLLLNIPALVSWFIALGTALALYLTETLHLFFLFMPVFALTSVLYILLTRSFVERDGAPEEPAPVEPTETPTLSSLRERASPAPAILWVTGSLALASLVACAVLPFIVYAAGGENHSEVMSSFHRWLMVPTAVYFVSGTIFYNLRRGAKTP